MLFFHIVLQTSPLKNLRQKKKIKIKIVKRVYLYPIKSKNMCYKFKGKKKKLSYARAWEDIYVLMLKLNAIENTKTL